MVLNDTLANALSKINNAVLGLSKTVEIPNSKLIVKVLEVLKKNDFIGDFTIDKKTNQGEIVVNLVGTINKCQVIKPRYQTSVKNIEKFEKLYLPAKDFGILIISTNKGIFTQNEIKEKNIGGVLLGFCY